MSVARRIEDLMLEAEFYCRVNAARRTMKLKDLASSLGVDLTTLSKYVNMHIKPSRPRMRELGEKLRDVDYKSVIRDCLIWQPYPFPEMNNLLFKCHELLDCAVYEFLKELGGVVFDYILTVEGGGLALAQAIASRLKLPVVYGLRDIIIRGGHSIPYKYTPVYAWGPRIKRYITLPLGRELKNKRVVVVDDIAWTGATVMTLAEYAARKKCDVVGVFLLATFGDVYERLVGKLGSRLHVVLILPNEARKSVMSEFEFI
ncbi:phosphoribosyltransferase family protein [Thermogladius sp.]|uniref:phosphoribosyltransferase family protein n=1 Tax=Thermogladius sp. TaxID=2023064 RepID=UPI003D13FC0E